MKRISTLIALLASVLLGICQGVEIEDKETEETRLQLEESTTVPVPVVLDSLTLDEALKENQEAFSYITLSHSNSKLSLLNELELALEAAPNDLNLLGEALEVYGMMDDGTSLKQTAEKMDALGALQRHRKYYALMSKQLRNNDVLITNGRSDTRPLLIERSKVNGNFAIIRAEWRNQVGYLNRLQMQGINSPDAILSTSQFILQLQQLNPQLRFALSPTLDKQVLSELSAELVSSGLVFRLGTQVIDDDERVYRRVKNELANMDARDLDQIGMNLLPMLRNTRLVYIGEGKDEKRMEVEELIESILQINQREDLIPALLN